MSSGDRLAIGRQIYQFFLSQGLAPHQAAAIAGNMAWEGGGRWDLVNPNDNPRGSPMSPHSAGIAQWNDRLPSLLAYARANGIEVPDGDLRDSRYVQDVIRRIPLQTQLGFAWQEMQGPERRAYDAILAGADLNTATAGAIGYHRPQGWTRGNPYGGHGFNGRLTLAQRILADGGSGGDTPQAPGTVPPTTPPTVVASADAPTTTPAPGTVVPGTSAPETPPPPSPFNLAGADQPDQGQAPPGSGLFGSLFSGMREQGDQGLANAFNVRTAAAADEPQTGITAPQTRQPQLDLTRLRSLLQGRGRLGTLRG